MSQNRIVLAGPAGRRVQVTVGYDRPLRELFSNVVPDQRDPTDYSSIQLASYDDVGDLEQAFSAIGMPLPRQVLDAADRDQANNVGNVVRRYDSTGALLEEVSC
jgi:hypothetical protein